DLRARRGKRSSFWRRNSGGNSRNTGGGRGFGYRKSSECKGLRGFRVRLLFSIGFLDAADVIQMDARSKCVRIVRRARLPFARRKDQKGASDEENYWIFADPGRVHAEPFGVLFQTGGRPMLWGWVPRVLIEWRAEDGRGAAACGGECTGTKERGGCSAISIVS